MKMHVFNDPFLIDFLIVAQQMTDDQRNQLEEMTGEKYDAERAAVAAFTTPGPKWVFKTDEGQPIAVGGYAPQRPGVWRDYMLTTDEAWSPTYFGAVTRRCVRIVEAMLKSGEAHRLECISLASRTKAHDWYRIVGLHKEGVLHGYAASGADAIIFARVQH